MARTTDQNGNSLGCNYFDDSLEVSEGEVWITLGLSGSYIFNSQEESEEITGHARSADIQTTWKAKRKIFPDGDKSIWEIVIHAFSNSCAPQYFFIAVQSFLTQLRITSVKVE